MVNISHKLDNYTKQALWVTHSKSCFYCRESIGFRNMHVDHVIPVKLFSSNESTIRTRYNLNATFDFNSLDNFVPSCPSCNSARKREKEISNGIPLWLSEVSDKKVEILKLAIKIKQLLTLDLPNEYQQYFLSSSDFLLSGLKINAIRKADIPIYKAMAFDQNYWQLKLTPPDGVGNVIPIGSLAQYEEWATKGYYGASTPDIAMSSFCEACLSFFKYFNNAIYIENKVGLTDYWLDLPASVLHVIGPEEDFSFHDFSSLRDYINAHSSIKIEYEEEGISMVVCDEQIDTQEIYFFKEILQADFSGEGKREAIVFIHYKSAGTFNLTYSILVVEDEGVWKFNHL